MKHKNNYWYSYTKTKPKGWKCIKPLIYSNEVNVKNDDGSIIGKMNIEYKIGEGRKINEEWLKENLILKFGKEIKFDISCFTRDSATMSFVENIYLTKEILIRIKREEKLKRICNDTED